MKKTTVPAGIAFAAVALLSGAAALAQPQFGNPSPNAGSSTSQQANAAADQAAYQEVEYTNKARKGPALVVIPGDIKSSNAGFMQKFGPNNIADFGDRNSWMDIHVDAGANRARRIVERLLADVRPEEVAG